MRALQLRHDATTLSHVWGPPRERGHDVIEVLGVACRSTGTGGGRGRTRLGARAAPWPETAPARSGRAGSPRAPARSGARNGTRRRCGGRSRPCPSGRARPRGGTRRHTAVRSWRSARAPEPRWSAPPLFRRESNGARAADLGAIPPCRGTTRGTRRCRRPAAARRGRTPSPSGTRGTRAAGRAGTARCATTAVARDAAHWRSGRPPQTRTARDRAERPEPERGARASEWSGRDHGPGVRRHGTDGSVGATSDRARHHGERRSPRDGGQRCTSLPGRRRRSRTRSTRSPARSNWCSKARGARSTSRSCVCSPRVTS